MKQVPLGPYGLPNDLERFRPVEREEVKDSIHKENYQLPLLQVQVMPMSSRIEMPVMLRASPMDRGGLHTWLATRKAESDKKREEEVNVIFILTAKNGNYGDVGKNMGE